MAIIYRTDGAWGSGKGANLAPAEVDGNFYDLAGRVSTIEDNPVEPIAPIAINIEGSAFTMGLSDGTTLGPIAITMPMPTWRGDWTPSFNYSELDFFIAPDGGLGAVMIPHTSAASFDWGALDSGTGLPLYRQLIGGSGTTSGLSDLIDVALSGQAANDMLVWDAAASLWRNKTPALVASILPAFIASTGSAAGVKGLVPAPAAGDAAAGKVLGAGGTWIVPTVGGGGSSSLAGLSDVSIVSPVDLSLLQYSMLDGKWHNKTLATLGAGTVTSVNTGGGLTGGPITGNGTITLAPVATLNLLANLAGASAIPGGVSLSALLDAVIGTGRGTLLQRGNAEWIALPPGTAGQFLRTNGSGADASWAMPAGGGTVTSVNSGPGLTGGPITASGTLSLAAVADKQLLANISGASGVPSGTGLSALLDNVFGSTQGAFLYRGATAWVVLAPGTAGQVLQTGGAGANPSWVSGVGSGTVTNIATSGGIVGGPITTTGTLSLATIADKTILSNLTGSTATPSGNSLSALIDGSFGAIRGNILYRGAAGWAALGPGTAGQVLTSGGAGADPSWANSAASISIGDTPPASPQPGSCWWDSVGGQLYIWYDDGTSSQWVLANGAAASLRYTIGFSFVGGVLGASQLLGLHRVTKAIQFPANFGSYLGQASQAGGTANATGSTVISVDRALAASPTTFSQIGTITIAAGTITPTFVTAAGAAIACAQGDVIRLQGPSTADATLANFYCTLVAQEA